MSSIEDLDREIEVAEKLLKKLKQRRDSETKIANLKLEIQKTRMQDRMEGLLATRFMRELRELLIKTAENRFVASFREAALKSIRKTAPKPNHSNQMVI